MTKSKIEKFGHLCGYQPDVLKCINEIKVLRKTLRKLLRAKGRKK